jgi:hypothetical protein
MQDIEHVAIFGIQPLLHLLQDILDALNRGKGREYLVKNVFDQFSTASATMTIIDTEISTTFDITVIIDYNVFILHMSPVLGILIE